MINVNDDEQKISSEEKSYFAMIPHMADDDLSPFAYRLYGHYRRVCGERGGTCRERIKTTAEKIGIAAGSVVNARRELEEKQFIRTKTRRVANYTKIDITLVDIWPRNIARYASPTIHQVNGESHRSPGESHRSPGESHRSPGEPEEELLSIKNSSKEENSLRSFSDERTNERIFALLTDPEIGMSSPKTLERIAAVYPFEDIRAFCCKFVQEQRTPSKDAGLIAYWLEAAEVIPVYCSGEFFNRHSEPHEQRSRYIPDEYEHLILH